MSRSRTASPSGVSRCGEPVADPEGAGHQAGDPRVALVPAALAPAEDAHVTDRAGADGEREADEADGQRSDESHRPILAGPSRTDVGCRVASVREGPVDSAGHGATVPQPPPPPRLPQAVDRRDRHRLRAARSRSWPCRSSPRPSLEVTPFEFGLLTTIEFLPFILFSLPAGVWVDRLRRRPILIAGDLGRAIAIASIPVAFAFDALTIWQLYIVGFINGMPHRVLRRRVPELRAVGRRPRPARRRATPSSRSRGARRRSWARAWRASSSGVLKAPFAMLLDSLSYVVSAIFVFFIRRPEPPVVAARRGGARPEAVNAPGDRGRAALRDRPPLAAERSPRRPAPRTSSATSAGRS